MVSGAALFEVIHNPKGHLVDVRPAIADSSVYVLPSFYPEGTPRTVLEAMAMARPVLVSRKGLEGIDARDGEEVLLADSPTDYQRLLAEVLAGMHAPLGERARSCVQRGFSWEENLPEVVSLLGDEGAVPRYGRESQKRGRCT